MLNYNLTTLVTIALQFVNGNAIDFYICFLESRYEISNSIMGSSSPDN